MNKLPIDRIEDKLIMPHCDSKVLHRDCRYCNDRPDLQQYRIDNGINFTGEYLEGYELCPSERSRPLSTINKWGGNVAVPNIDLGPLTEVVVATTKGGLAIKQSEWIADISETAMEQAQILAPPITDEFRKLSGMPLSKETKKEDATYILKGHLLTDIKVKEKDLTEFKKLAGITPSSLKKSLSSAEAAEVAKILANLIKRDPEAEDAPLATYENMEERLKATEAAMDVWSDLL